MECVALQGFFVSLSLALASDEEERDEANDKKNDYRDDDGFEEDLNDTHCGSYGYRAGNGNYCCARFVKGKEYSALMIYQLSKGS